MENKEKHTTLSLPTFKETDNIKSAVEYLLTGNLNLHASQEIWEMLQYGKDHQPGILYGKNHHTWKMRATDQANDT